MFIVGMDLSGPSNSKETAIVCFEGSSKGDLTLKRALQGADDNDVLFLARALQLQGGELIVGIDAPLSYNAGGGDRQSDAELRRTVISLGMRPGSVMVPTMNRMVYLTLRGISIARLLLAVHAGTRIVEVHPGASMALRGAPVDDVVAFKKDEKSRWRLLTWLEQQGMKKITNTMALSDHYVAACASALTAWKWQQNKAAWIFPAEPPLHPFDYAC